MEFYSWTIKMNRQELLEYLRVVSQTENDHWNSIRYCHDLYDSFVAFNNNDSGRYDYFFTELIKRVWEKIYGNRDVESEKIGINLLKFLCGIRNEICFSMYGDTSALDNATVYTEGMLDITIETDKEFNYIGKFMVDCNLDAGDYKIDANWCVNCSCTKIPSIKKEYSLIQCYNCTNSFDVKFCANCNDCINCKNCNNCIKCTGCCLSTNCNICDNLSVCNDCSNCRACIRCNNIINCTICNCCEKCIDCKYLTCCKNCKKCTTCHESDNISACSHCDNCSNCDNCTKCANCDNCSRCNNCSYCNNSKECQNCKKCSGCVNNVKCKHNIDCKDCINCKDCKKCTGCDECNRCVGCANCKKCSGCKNCSKCSKCINQKRKHDDTEKYFNRMEINIPKEIIAIRCSLIVDLSVNGDRIEMDNTFIQYYDSNDNLLFQGICQYKHPRAYYENCMNFVIGQGWFYYPDTHEPRCYVNLSTKSKYSITVQDIVDLCDSNNDFIEFLQTRTMKMRNSNVYIYDRSGNLMRNESTINI